MYLKIAIILAWLASSYVLLVFFASTWWECLLLSIAIGMAMGAVGFNIQHDGGHHAVSRFDWVNRLAARSLDLIGGSSYTWHWKHAVIHHTYVNITGHDTDIDLSPFGRLTPHQKWRSFHRFQHLYVWALYGFLTMKWQTYDDFHDVIVGRVGGQRFPRPKGWDLLNFLGMKALFFTLAFGIPLMLHPVWAVALWFFVASVVLGVVMATVFQLAHCVSEAEFPLPQPETGRMKHCWAVHQVETTVNFSRKSNVICWLLGGLNFQIEHHLFPRICHVNYPALSEVVEATCKEFGVKYVEHTSFWAGMVSHYRWLRQMGRRDEAAVAISSLSEPEA